MESYYEYCSKGSLPEQAGQVLTLAEKSVRPLVAKGLPEKLSHLIVATTCPDTLAPSLGQTLIEKFNTPLSGCHSIDIVQGCAGGVSALILASQLAEVNRSSVLVVLADAAAKSTSHSNRLSKNFGNGSFSCLISYQHSELGLIHSKSIHYKGLTEVVNINLGHDADRIIMLERNTMNTDPRKHLGLQMNNNLAIKLLRKAERFFQDFIKETGIPDVVIPHQVNPLILAHLAGVFRKYRTEFINVADQAGNCGVASIGIALDSIKDSMKGKKIFVGSFGTGGVITAGLWRT